MFLDSLRERQEAEERERREKDGEEVQSFKEYTLSPSSLPFSKPLQSRCCAQQCRQQPSPDSTQTCSGSSSL
jgi:hypothetical protein